jgi:hypothetical protein
MMSNRRWNGLLLLAAFTAACQDLEVMNPNNPDRERALRRAGDVETLAGSTWRDLWAVWHSTDDVYNLYPVVADAFSATYANHGALELSSEPRVPFNNGPLAETQLASGELWESLNQGVSSSIEVQRAIAGGLQIITPTTPGGAVGDNTMRAYTYARLNMGIAYGHLAMMYDRAMVPNEDKDLSDAEVLRSLRYQPYGEVLDSAFKFVQSAVDSATKYNFTLLPTWIPGTTFTNQDLVRIGNSFLARFLVYGARTPEERAAVNWNRVIEYVDKGITSNYTVTLQSGILTSGFLSRLQQTGTFSAWGDYKMIGLADVSGNFQAWLAKPVPQRERFLITTPDRRITGLTPASNGTYFRYRADNIMRPERGTYHHSHYQWFRNAGRSTSQGYTIMSLDEMSLLKAEALIRLGRVAEALPLVNRTRTRTQRIGTVDYPGLPAVTAEGVPQAADCVPKMPSGACGNLMEALMYERMIETYAQDAIMAYMDSRGWGRLPTGTFLHLPVPGTELLSLGFELYSFGGVGGPGAAR